MLILNEMNSIWKYLVINKIREKQNIHDLTTDKFANMKGSKYESKNYKPYHQIIFNIDLKFPKDMRFLTWSLVNGVIQVKTSDADINKVNLECNDLDGFLHSRKTNKKRNIS
jgi:hypothetical protein